MPESMTESVPPTPKYFFDKLTQERELIVEIDRQASHAMDIAWQVLRLCYPMRQTSKVRMYYNFSPFAPFLRAEHEGLDIKGMNFATADMRRAAKKTTVPIKDHVVVDVHYFLDSIHENESFLIEVAIPQGLQRARWDIVRVRWCDLGWTTNGGGSDDVPLPHLCGEAYVNHWG